MKTCELCGERNHDGPCYAELRAQWKQEDAETWITHHGFKVLKVEGDMERWVRSLVIKKDAA